MKILQVIDTLNIGGAERVFVDMCNILKDNNQDVSALVLLKNRGELVSQLKVPILTFFRSNKWSIYSMYRCYNILKKHDIIHCHSKHVFRYIKLISILFKCNQKLILQDHSSSKISGKQLIIFKHILRPDYYIGVSTAINQHAIHQLELNSKNVFLLENIIIKSASIEALFPTDFVLVSNIKSTKNNLFALEILNLFNEKSIRVIGHIQEFKYYDKMRSYSNLNKLKVDFITNLQEVQPVLKNSKIGLHPSPLETGPLALIEYLAQGVPFLAYETGEVAKILKPHFPEYFIDNFELEKWKNRIESLLSTPADVEKMNAVFEKYFGKLQYYDKLKGIYKCINDY